MIEIRIRTVNLPAWSETTRSVNGSQVRSHFSSLPGALSLFQTPSLQPRGMLRLVERILRALAFVAILVSGLAAAQPLTERYADIGTMIVTTSAYTMFPHEKRAKGYTYEGKSYPADLH